MEQPTTAIRAPEKTIEQASAAVMQALERADGAIALPSDFKLQDLEKFLPYRRRPMGIMKTPYINDFAAYTQAHKQDGCSVFIDATEMSATAVLDLGSPTHPGHCANRVKLGLEPTAAFIALRTFVNEPHDQTETAEWLEDWAPQLHAQADGAEIEMRKAISAVRKITTEAIARAQYEEQALSSAKSTFESVHVSSAEPLPTHFKMTCRPYPELQEREFVLRMSVLTGPKPQMVLRPMGWEQVIEAMATEFATDLRAAFEGTLPVLIGTYGKQD